MREGAGTLVEWRALGVAGGQALVKDMENDEIATPLRARSSASEKDESAGKKRALCERARKKKNPKERALAKISVTDW